MPGPELTIIALASGIGRSRVEVGDALSCGFLDHGLRFRLAIVGAEHSFAPQPNLGDLGAGLSE